MSQTIQQVGLQYRFTQVKFQAIYMYLIAVCGSYYSYNGNFVYEFCASFFTFLVSNSYWVFEAVYTRHPFCEIILQKFRGRFLLKKI